jgi:hypothetical protein
MAAPDLPSLIRADLARHAWWVIYLCYVFAIAIPLGTIILTSAWARNWTVSRRMESPAPWSRSMFCMGFISAVPRGKRGVRHGGR